jgi:hypothetical protein
MTPFTFDSSAAAGTSAAAEATSGGVTPWYRLSNRTESSSFILSGTFVGTINPEYSNSADFDKGTDYVADSNSYTVPTLRELPLGIADFVRFRCTAYTSGSPKVSLARALGVGGIPQAIGEDSKKTPSPSSAGA